MKTMYHQCMVKIKIIFERTGILLGHDEISTLCEIWKCTTAEEFYFKLDYLSDEELTREIQEKILKKKKKRKEILHNYLEQERKIYA
jgi:hypothetical protein